MARSRNTLGHVFGRELEAAGRWIGGARTLLQRALGRRARRATTTRGVPAATPSRAPRAEVPGLSGPARPARTRQGWRSPPPDEGRGHGAPWIVPASVLASLSAHAAFLGVLVVIWIPGRHPAGSEGSGHGGESTLSFRLVPGARARRLEPPPHQPLPPPPVEPVPAPEDSRSPPPADIARKDAVPDEPARGEPDGSGKDAGGRPAGEALPLPVGLGGSPLPLPGQGGGSLRGYSSRGQGKGNALVIYGGTGATEGAVSRGLRWLADHQDEGGGWSAESFDRHCRHHLRCGGKGMTEFDVGVTALSVLAFLGAGHVPEGPGSASDPAAASPYRRNVKKALDHLLSRQDGRGAFGSVGDNYLYNHAIATFAIGEAHAMTGTARYREGLEAALAFTFSAQQGGGGWDYTAQATGRNDLSITGWQIMALRSADLAGVSVPESVLDRLRRYLDAAVTGGGEGIYANIGTEAGRRGINMVAVGLLSRLYMGAGRDDVKVRRAAEKLLRSPPDWEKTGDWDRTFESYYYWYTATLALFNLGGEEWRAWNFFVARTLLALQSRKTHEEGSWPPEPNWVGASGGRVYATAINVLTLETYYRYEPIYRTPRKRS